MSNIGGYFELELNTQGEYHEDAIRLNTGRNALEYIILANNYKKIHIPYFTCGVLLQPLNKTHITYEFYHIDENFEPIFDFSKIKDEAFLYTNYFGLKDNYILNLSGKCKNLIIDNAQAFYSKPIKGLNTFYSPRKFFGVTDGAYLFTDKTLKTTLKKDQSYQRFQHLLQRIDEGAEEGYNHFIKNETLLNDLPIMQMSALTQKLLEAIDYKAVALKRISNFEYLAEHLKGINKIAFKLNKDQVPMVYPLLTDDVDLRDKLIKHKVYTSHYWDEVNNLVTKNSNEYTFANKLVHLPIDQRYNKDDLAKIIDIIQKCR